MFNFCPRVLKDCSDLKFNHKVAKIYILKQFHTWTLQFAQQMEALISESIVLAEQLTLVDDLYDFQLLRNARPDFLDVV